MNDNIKKAAEQYAETQNDAYTNDYYGFIAGATSEAAREYWERGPEKQEGEMYVNVYKNTQGEPHNGAIYYSITEAVEMGIGAGYVGTYRLVKVETNQNE